MVSSLQIIFFTIAAALAIHYSGKSTLVMRKLTELAHGKPGCGPVPNVGNATLYYFKGRGRAEVVRLILEEAQIPYTEVLYTKKQWTDRAKKEGTESGLFTFSQVPALETVNGVRLVHSHVITHYLGSSAGFDCDCEDLYFCDMLSNGVEDVRQKFGRMMYSPQYLVKDREEYLQTTLPMWLGFFEKLAPPLSKQQGSYFASERLTWVDVLVFDMLESNAQFAVHDSDKGLLSVDLLADFPKLNNFYRQFAARPNIAAYINSKRRLPFSVYQAPQKQ